MPIPFFYTEPVNTIEPLVILNEDNSKHAVQVLRMQNGEIIKLADGLGNIYTTEIIDAHKKKAVVKIIDKLFVEQRKNKVCIAISPLKNNSRLEWFLEKATEIGVSEIVLLQCQRTEKQNIKMERLKNILISAILQSQQAWLPIFEEPKKYTEFIKVKNESNKLIAHCLEENKESLKNFSTTIKKYNNTTILIGPEGDFTTEEIQLALQNNYNAVSLGNTRLRTETAALVAATLLCVE